MEYNVGQEVWISLSLLCSAWSNAETWAQDVRRGRREGHDAVLHLFRWHGTYRFEFWFQWRMSLPSWASLRGFMLQHSLSQSSVLEFGTKAQMWNSAFSFCHCPLGCIFLGLLKGTGFWLERKKDLSIFYFPSYDLIPPQFPPEFLTARTRFP